MAKARIEVTTLKHAEATRRNIRTAELETLMRRPRRTTARNTSPKTYFSLLTYQSLVPRPDYLSEAHRRHRHHEA